jgi:hypothetical protein
MRSAPQVAATSSSSSTSTPPTGTSVSITTPAIVSGSSEVTTLAMAKMFQVYQVQVSGPTRIRLYATAAAQTLDASRSNSVPPTPGTQHGVLLDLYLDTADKWNWMCSPIAPGYNNDSPQSTTIYATITNIDTVNAAISLQINYVPLES